MFTYLVSDYAATGEGRTVSVLVTRSYLYDEPFSGPDGKTPMDRMKEAFNKIFDDWYTIGAEEVSKHDFEENFAWTMPEAVYDLINIDTPPGFSWHTQIHFNYS